MKNTRRDFLKKGAIGRVYFGKGWYTNTRKPIGRGKAVAPPDWLDWDLWQGPAPRKQYKDNIVHYNWHWFWHWGTGEALNNGTHMVDLLRWGLEVDYPVKVSSNGGRYHYAGDDWETPDTQIINLDFADKKTISWEGRSCNGRPIDGIGVGAIFYGEKGSIQIDGNGYVVYDLKGEEVKNSKDDAKVNARDKANPSKNLDALHIQNFFGAITSGEKLNADIDSGHKSTLLVQLGNIAQRTGRSLNIDPNTGHILNDKEALKLWSRKYESGWEMK
jgi:predicted dehydrogenase